MLSRYAYRLSFFRSPTLYVLQLPRISGAVGPTGKLGTPTNALPWHLPKVPCKIEAWRARATAAPGIYDQIREVMPMQGGLVSSVCGELAREVAPVFIDHCRSDLRRGKRGVQSAIERIALQQRWRYGHRQDNLMVAQLNAFLTRDSRPSAGTNASRHSDARNAYVSLR